MDNIRNLVFAAGLLGVPCPSHAQTGHSTVYDPSIIGTPGTRPGQTSDTFEIGPEAASIRARRENAIKLQRRQRLVASADRLVTLTKQFQSDSALHPSLTPDDERRLDDIAKLAHEVRSRMLE